MSELVEYKPGTTFPGVIGRMVSELSPPGRSQSGLKKDRPTSSSLFWMMWATGKYWPSDASLYSIIIADVTEEPLVLHLLDTNDHYSSLIKLCKFEGRGNSSYEGLI